MKTLEKLIRKLSGPHPFKKTHPYTILPPTFYCKLDSFLRMRQIKFNSPASPKRGCPNYVNA